MVAMVQPLQSEQQVITNHDWDQVRPLFTRMYQEDGMKLKDIMTILSDRHGFTAPVHMYKKRITQWGLGKSFTSGEKAKYADLARERLAVGRSLPLKDEFGRSIPWDRVRRQQGRQSIPTKALPRHPKTEKRNQQMFQGIMALTKTKSEDRCAQSANGDDATEMMVPSDTKISAPVMASDGMRRLEHMFYYVQCYYSWHGYGAHQDGSDVGSFYNIYFDAFQKLTHCSSLSRLKILSSASKAVVPVLRKITIDLLNALLSIIIESIQCLPVTHTLALIRFFAAACRQELGLYNPLSILIQTISEQARHSTAGKSAHKNIMTDIPFVRLMEDAGRQIEASSALRTNKTDASYNAQWIHVYFLLRLSQNRTFSNRDAALQNAKEAELACHRLVLQSAQIFGLQSSNSMRAKIGLAQAMWLQGRRAEARFVLECVWKAWISNTSACGFPMLKKEMDWCPAKQLADIHDLEGDLAAARYYGFEAFEWSYFRYGPGDGETLHLFAKQIERLEQAGNFAHRDRLMRLYPVACQLLRLYAANADANE